MYHNLISPLLSDVYYRGATYFLLFINIRGLCIVRGWRMIKNPLNKRLMDVYWRRKLQLNLINLQEHNKENILQNGQPKVDLQKIFTPATDTEEIKPARMRECYLLLSHLRTYSVAPTPHSLFLCCRIKTPKSRFVGDIGYHAQGQYVL